MVKRLADPAVTDSPASDIIAMPCSWRTGNAWWRMAMLALLTIPAIPAAQAEEIALENILDLSLEQLSQVRITVASLLPSTLLDVGSSLVVVEEGDWRPLGACHISDIVGAVPGVSVVPSLAGSDAYAIRGYTRNTSLFGVALTWDGVPLNDFSRGAPALFLPRLNLGAINKIEMIEGPGSALYGSDAFHGVIALRAYDGANPEREISSSLGSDGYSTLNLRQTHNSDNHIRTSLALALDDQPNQQRDFSYSDPSTGLMQQGERENRYGAQTASLKFQGDTSQTYRWRSGILLHHFAGNNFQGFGTRVAGTQDLGGINTRFYLANAAVERDLESAATLELSGYGWRANSNFIAGKISGDSEFFSVQHRYGSQLLYRQQLPQLNSNWALALAAEVLGVDTANTQTYTPSGAQLTDVTYPAQGADRYIKSATFEGNTQWAEQQWQLIYGARLDHYSDFNNQVSPRLGIIWQPQSDKAIKLLYGNAFRAPAANDRLGVPGVIGGNKNLRPETINTLELILMQERNNWLHQLTLFRSHWQNGIVSSANPGGPLPFTRENAEDNRAQGLTWDIKWQPNAWSVQLGSSWVESENTTQDNDYSAFPRYSIQLQTSYHYQPWRTRFTLSQHWQFDTNDLFAPSAGIAAQPLDNYARTDIGVVHRLEDNAELQFFIRNLFDRDNFLPSGAGSRGGIPDESLSVSVGFRYGF